MAPLDVGIVGTGFIAGVIARALDRSESCRLAAVSSRRLDRAEAFVASHPGVQACEGHQALLERVEAVYVATPTAAKETIALEAVGAGRSVLVDKPFSSTASLERIVATCRAADVAFMDATHFVHHPRTAALRRAIRDDLGGAHTLRAAFYFPFAEPTNIRYDVSQEPSGAVGDLGWYTARAAIEFLDPGPLTDVCVHRRRDLESGAIVHADGLLRFASDQASTFSVGYDGGALAMDLQIIGPQGMLVLDDFVLDWANSFAYDDPEHRAGYRRRQGVTPAPAATVVEAASEVPAQVRMLEAFADQHAKGFGAAWAEVSRRTQVLVDRILDS
jgi:predicted dehydrogenase